MSNIITELKDDLRDDLSFMIDNNFDEEDIVSHRKDRLGKIELVEKEINEAKGVGAWILVGATVAAATSGLLAGFILTTTFM